MATLWYGFKACRERSEVRIPVWASTDVMHHNSWTTGRIGTKICVRVDIDDGKNVLEGQGHKVKGQGQIGDFVENLFGL